jgi:hypothetical protein
MELPLSKNKIKIKPEEKITIRFGLKNSVVVAEISHLKKALGKNQTEHCEKRFSILEADL